MNFDRLRMWTERAESFFWGLKKRGAVKYLFCRTRSYEQPVVLNVSCKTLQIVASPNFSNIWYADKQGKRRYLSVLRYVRTGRRKRQILLRTWRRQVINGLISPIMEMPKFARFVIWWAALLSSRNERLNFALKFPERPALYLRFLTILATLEHQPVFITVISWCGLWTSYGGYQGSLSSMKNFRRFLDNLGYVYCLEMTTRLTICF